MQAHGLRNSLIMGKLAVFLFKMPCNLLQYFGLFLALGVSSIASASVLIQGTLHFENRAYDKSGWTPEADGPQPSKGVNVEIRDPTNGNLLGSTISSNSGMFVVNVSSLTAGAPYNVKVIAESDFAVVSQYPSRVGIYSNTFGPYTSTSPSIVVQRTGQTAALARSLNMLAVVREAYAWAFARSGVAFEQVGIVYPYESRPLYAPVENTIYIPSDGVAESDDTILHEYGHFLWDKYTTILPFGENVPHDSCSPIDSGRVFSESWANWVLLSVRNKNWSVAASANGVTPMVELADYGSFRSTTIPDGILNCKEATGADSELAVTALLSATNDAANPPADIVSNQMQKTWDILKRWDLRLTAPTIHDFRAEWANEAEMVPLFCKYIYQPPLFAGVSSTAVTQSGAMLNASVDGRGCEVDVYFEYSRDLSGAFNTLAVTSLGSTAGSTAVSAQISALQCGVQYQYRVRATSPGVSQVSNVYTFSTGACTTPQNVAPFADYSYTTSGLLVTFTDSSSDSDGHIVARNWSFGDSTVSSATNPTKSYAASGTYNVTLTVTDNSGATSSRLRQVTVAAITQLPSLVNSAATNISATGVTLNASVVSDGGLPILERRFEWDTTPAWTSSTASNFYGGAINVVGSAFSYAITTLVPNTTYYFRAYARNANGWAIAGNTLTFTTLSGQDQIPPVSPVGLTASAVSPNQVNLTWNASSDAGGSGLAGYKIQRCQGAGCSNFTQVNAIAFNAYNDTSGLSASTTYQYRVLAFDNAGNNSGFSNVAIATTQAVSTTTVPTTVAVAATNIAGTTATLNGMVTFDGGLPTLERMFEWGPTPNITTIVTTGITVSGSSFSYNLTGLSPETSYTFRALARNSAGWAVVPGYLSFTTGPAPDTTPPSVPAGLVAIPISTSQIDLSWSPSTDTGGSGLSGYRVERCAGVGCSIFSQVGVPTNSAFSDAAGLSPGTTYRYRVRAFDALSNASDYSMPVEATTLLPVDTTPPTVISTNPGNASTGAIVNGALTVVFSEPIDFYSVTNTTFVLRDSANNVVPGSALVALNQASFTPASNLAFNATYTATLTTGIKDYAGNTLASPFVWSFTTRSAATSTLSQVSGPLSVNTTATVRPTIQKHGSNIYVVDSNANRDLLFYKSADLGASFGSTVLANPVTNAEQFDFCKDGAGNLFVFYTNSVDSKVYLRRSVDAGANWSAPQVMGSGYAWMDSQSCTVAGGTLYLVFRAFASSKIELYITKSTDAGVTFSAPMQVTSNTYQEDNPKVAAIGSTVYVAYLDQYSASPKNLWIHKSIDGGNSFGGAVRVNRTLGGAQTNLGLGLNSAGHIFVAYADTSANSGDLYVARSTNAGATFTSVLAADSTISEQGNPRLFVDANDNVHVSWQDLRSLFYRSVYYTRSVDGGASFAPNANLRSTDRLENGSLIVDGSSAYLAVIDTAVSPRASAIFSVNWLSGSVAASPTGVSAIAGDTAATVSFVAPTDNGGNAVTGYRVTGNPGGISTIAASSPITVSGLSNGTAYSFVVRAINAIGESVPSVASNTVVPSAPVPPQCNLTASPNTIVAGMATTLSVTCTPGATSYVWTNTGFSSTQTTGTVSPMVSATYIVSGINGVGQGGAASVTVSVLAASGSITVNLSPSGAIAAAAQWRLDGGAFQSSGATLSGIAAGSHLLSFKSVPGWTAPPDRTVVISAGQQLTENGTYLATPNPVTLTVLAAGAGAGTVSYSGGYTCPMTCSRDFDAGTTIALTATPSSGSTFAGWSGGGCSGLGLCTLTISAATSVAATFLLQTASVPSAPRLPVATAGSGFISIAFDPPTSDGGAAITNYNARCNGGAVTASAVSSPILLQGLTNGVAYSCTVTALNSAGEGLPSPAISAIPQGQVALSGVYSRKIHAGAGAFDLGIDLTKAVSDHVTVEPRVPGSGYLLVFRFNEPISSVGSIGIVDSLGVPVTFVPSIIGNEIVLTLSGALNAKRVTASVSGVNGIGAALASIGFLLGDVNGSRAVDNADASAIRSRAGQPASPNNYQYDINVSGTVSASDIAAAKSRRGTSLP